jgi:hypothetical protein
MSVAAMKYSSVRHDYQLRVHQFYLRSSTSPALARCSRLRRKSRSGHMGRQRDHMGDGFRSHRSWSSIRVRLSPLLNSSKV